MVQKNQNIVISINREEANLSIIYNYYVTSAQKKCYGPLFISGMAFISFDYLDLFADLRTDTDSSGKQREFILTEKFYNLSQLCGPCVGYSKIKM